MKALAFTLYACAFLLSTLAYASEPSLWAFNEGPVWDEQSLGLLIDPYPFSTSPGAYPPGWNYLIDASYDMSSSILYVSGTLSTSPAWWYQNTIGVFSGGAGGLDYVSSSNAGMGDDDGYHWLGGIALMDDCLYAISYIGYAEGNVLLRIDSPGTAAQAVTQIGPVLGDTDSLGIPFNLCTDGHGALLSFLRPSSISGAPDSTLYRIDPVTGGLTALHSYPDSLIDGYIEGLTRCGEDLYGVNTDGRLFRFDLQTYEATVLGDLGQSDLWTGLVTIPEPSTISVLGLALVAGVLWRRARRR
ncbi:MAG: PEP-CTERM sorting domain-containing protein [Verrucomicrobia bacterium]|nr:PEP-CTERM sorting domain-containing protein [Verrucomicrobiota bacterium]